MPAINASLNGAACLCLIAGFICVRKHRISAHRQLMLSASVLSGLFLICYTIHYIWRMMEKGGLHTKYHGTGWLRTFYYSMLFSHIVLAVTVPFFAIWLIRLGLTQQYHRHRKVARVGYPIWMYVSVTGVLIYFMLYHWFPAGAPG